MFRTSVKSSRTPGGRLPKSFKTVAGARTKLVPIGPWRWGGQILARTFFRIPRENTRKKDWNFCLLERRFGSRPTITAHDTAGHYPKMQNMASISTDPNGGYRVQFVDDLED